MSYSTIGRNEIKQFSKFSCDFCDQRTFESLLNKPFVSLTDLSFQANQKQQHYSDSNRQVLVDSLSKQLASFASDSQLENIKLLSEPNTFTITTGHQLTLFGGPMYLLYKALHVVSLSKQYNQSQSEYKTVPVFWMASEDHDFEEVKHAHLFGKKLSWETSQSGAVGRFENTNFDSIHQEFSTFFSEKETEIKALLEIGFTSNYAQYWQQFLSKIFADFGVLVLDADDKNLKQLFVPVMERELLESLSFSAVNKSNQQIEALGYTPQAQAREVNLFYLSDGKRIRIEKTSIGYAIDNLEFTEQELLERLMSEPENFSPNVILRPVYQETILPNLAYVGGGGEMAYWIQLKGVFEAHQTVFPLIQQRVSIHLIDSAMQKRIQKLNLKISNFFTQKELLRKQFIDKNESDSIQMEEVRSLIQMLRSKLLGNALKIDASLENFVEAELVRMSKQIDSIEQKFLKQLKQRHEQSLQGIDFVVDRTIPENSLQERYFHWLHFAPDGSYSKLLSRLATEINPFETELMVIDLSN